MIGGLIQRRKTEKMRARRQSAPRRATPRRETRARTTSTDSHAFPIHLRAASGASASMAHQGAGHPPPGGQMEFMSFNAQAYPNYAAYANPGPGGGGGGAYGHAQTSAAAAGGGSGFGFGDGHARMPSFTAGEDEAPLLEELGVDPKQIYRRTMGIIHPFRIEDSADEDLAGPLLFCLAMGAFNLLAGKLHFGYILGWSTLASLAMYWLLNQIIIGAGEGIGLNRCGSILGYALLPEVVYSGIVLFLPSKTGTLSMALAATCVMWSSRKASTMLIKAMPQSEGKRMIVTYPCMMLYCLYIVFSMS